MNTFKGHINIYNLKGLKSKAAKAAFADIRKDKSMRVHVECPLNGWEELQNIILNESILTDTLYE